MKEDFGGTTRLLDGQYESGNAGQRSIYVKMLGMTRIIETLQIELFITKFSNFEFEPNHNNKTQKIYT